MERHFELPTPLLILTLLVGGLGSILLRKWYAYLLTLLVAGYLVATFAYSPPAVSYKEQALLQVQILDDGRVTDAQGRVVNFENTIIVMTSNVGGNDMGTATVGFSSSDQNKNNRAYKVREKIKHHFPTEFLNRIDGIIVFDPLDEESIRKITVKMLNESCEKISKSGINIEYSEDVISYLVNAERSKEYGAREIKRVVTTLFEDEYIDGLYNNNFIAGDKVLARVDDGKIVFEKL